VRDRMGVKIGEAFMSFAHPQWLRARELVLTGRVGALRSILGAFSYFKLDTANIRNIFEYGGGALYDIGCYPIAMSRFMFGSEPSRVVSLVERDPEMKIDRLTSALLEFPEGHALFTCGTQLVHYQRMQFLGTTGRIEIEIPFNAPPDRPCRIFVDDGRDIFGNGISIETIPTSDQYTIQAELFSKAIQEDGKVPVSIEDAIRNMAVIDAVFRSAETRRWEEPQT
jgi:predicted dehydrogenase